MSLTIEAAMGEGREALRSRVEDPRREAEILLMRVSNKPRSELIAWPKRELGEEVVCRYRDLLRRRADGEPVAYILGHREFWSLELQVSRDTLIPRHETERLVELAIERIPDDARHRVLDLGCGCGAIALALAVERPRIRVLATDKSPLALDVARHNASTLGLENVDFAQGDWLQALASGERFHLIASNPPYVATADPHLSEGDLPWEPRSALVAGSDGLAAIRRICRDAPERLETGGWLIVEHGPDQGRAIRDLMRESGMTAISSHRDLLGLQRVTVAQRS